MTTLRSLAVGAALGASLLTPARSAAQSDLAVRLEAAQHQELVIGDLDRAIALYREIAASRGDRNVVARALVALGRSYEKLGRAEARAAYLRVVTEFADQSAMATEARARLAALRGDQRPAQREPGVVVRQLWANAAFVDVHGLSPDGRYLAFVDWAGPALNGDSNLVGNADLAVYDIATGRSRLVTHRPPQSRIDTYVAGAIWSADGTRLAYTLWDTTWSHQELHVVRADGSGDRLLVANDELPQLLPLSWSPSGDFIVCLIIGWDDARRIGLVAVQDGAVRVLKTFGKHNPWPLDLSPDGRFIVYDYWQAEGTTRHDIFVLAVDGSQETRITEHPADDDRPFWTPDGQRVVFRSDRSGRTALWSVAVDDGRPVGAPALVRPDVGSMVNLGFTATGGLYYRVPMVVSDIYTADLTLSGAGSITNQHPLTDRYVGTNSAAQWSPDGKRIAYLSHRGGAGVHALYAVVKTVASGAEREFALPFPGVTRPQWSADGRHLFLEGRDTTAGPRNGARISLRLDLATGAVSEEALLRDGASFAGGGAEFVTSRQAAALRAAGVRLAGQTDRDFARQQEALRPGEQVLWVRNGVRKLLPNGGFEQIAPEGHMHAWELSPDGTRLALAIAGDSVQTQMSNVLRVLPVTGGKAVEVARVEPTNEITAVRWTPDGRTLLFAVTEGTTSDQHAVWRVSAGGGAAERIAALDDVPLADLRFAPDGRQVAFSRQERHTEIWIMEGFPWSVARRD